MRRSPAGCTTPRTRIAVSAGKCSKATEARLPPPPFLFSTSGCSLRSVLHAHARWRRFLASTISHACESSLLQSTPLSGPPKAAGTCHHFDPALVAPSRRSGTASAVLHRYTYTTTESACGASPLSSAVHVRSRPLAFPRGQPYFWFSRIHGIGTWRVNTSPCSSRDRT